MVELVQMEVETARQGPHRAAAGAQGNQRALYGRQLRQPPALLGGLQADQVANAENFADGSRAAAAHIDLNIGSPTQTCQGQSDLIPGRQPHLGGSLLLVNRGDRGRNQTAVGRLFRQGRQGVLQVLELGFRAAVAVASVVGDQALAQGFGGGGLQAPVQSGVNLIAAGVDIRDAAKQGLPHPFRRKGRRHVQGAAMQLGADGRCHRLLVLRLADGALAAHSGQH